MGAKYLVTVPPGCPVPNVGFVKVGEVFTALPGFVPSRTLRPVNEEARVELEKVFAAYRTVLEARIAEASSADRHQLRSALERLEHDRQTHLAVVEIKREVPAVEPGLSLAELDELQGRELTQHTEKKAAPAAPAPSGKRAADK
jgi:hypothetical protein